MMLDGEEPTDLPEEAPPPPSSPPVSGWTSRLVYLLVSAGNWLVMLISLITFAALGLRWLLRYGGPEPDRWLIWLLYAAFALQGAISIVVDASGALSGNLALRIFPSFSLIAVGMVASLPDTFHPGRLRGAVAALLGALTAVLIVLAILKATNEPILSNKWIFYGPGELAALRWADTHNQGADIWSEFDERLSVAYYAAYGDSARGNRVIGYRSETTRDAMLSLITRLRAARIGAAAPVPPDALCIYDNGEAQIYHFRPSTPFQR
ncbi:MAG: hypothetical protein HGA19_14150 [Oscillochloris sp.]|nr:hypothetical protein [Oscillochloris sp.]